MPFTSYFFTELDAFTATTQNQSFGPLNENIFNITSGFTLTASKKAFAICKGVVLIQPQSGSSDKVNLILRPFNQPFPDINVKYFIYRGLKKDKFFTSGTNPDVIVAGTNSSEFVNKIRTNFSDFFTNRNIAVPDFKATFLGFNEDTTIVLPSTDISDLFFKEAILEDDGNGNGVEDTAVAFELPMAEAGMHVGDFATGDCGIDVVLDYGDYKMDFDNQEFVFDLNYARLPFASIEIPSGLTEVQMKRIREQSTQFIDIVAYFGMFFKDGVVKIKQGANFMDKKGDEIYNDIQSKFHSKNNWYIYIHGDRGRSYNYYGNYSIDEEATEPKSLKMGNSDSTMAEITYQTFSWPLLIKNTASAPNSSSCDLFMQFVTDNNPETCLFVDFEDAVNAQQNGFCDAEFLQLPPDNEGVLSRLSKIIHLTKFSTTQGMPKGSLSWIYYKGIKYRFRIGTITNEDNLITEYYATNYYFDDLFSTIKIKFLFNSSIQSTISKAINKKKELISNRNKSEVSITNNVTIFDSVKYNNDLNNLKNRVTYLTENIEVSSNKISPVEKSNSIQTNISISGNSLNRDVFDLNDPYYFEVLNFSDEKINVRGLMIKSINEESVSFMILGISESENNLLKLIISESNVILDPRICLYEINRNGEDYISQENLNFHKYLLALIAENENGVLQLYRPQSDISIYSLDKQCFFSKEYSEYFFPKDMVSDNVIFNIDK